MASREQRPFPAPKIEIEGSPFWVRREMTSGAIEAIKWLAILTMTIDHIDYILLGRNVYPMFALGRLAMPLFFLLFAYNMARPSIGDRNHFTAMKRLLAFALAAHLPYIGANGWSYTGELNILFSLFLLACLFYLSDQAQKLIGAQRWSAYVAFALVYGAGAFVEFGWVGLALGLAARASFRTPTPVTIMALAAALSALYFINGNPVAVLALPIFVVTSHWNPPIRRSPWFLYYSYYPAHIAGLLAMQPLFR